MSSGVSGTRSGGAGKVSGNAPQGFVSPTSTGGKIESKGFGAWGGENDNGSSVTILDLGKSDYNFYQYGSKQVYEVNRYIQPTAYSTGATDPPKQYAFTKKEAMNLAKGWLKSNK